MALQTTHAFDVPGHDRDALPESEQAFYVAALNELDDLVYDEDLGWIDVEHPMHSQAAVDAVDVVGFDDARVILEQLAYDEWASEFDPTDDDTAAATLAAQG